MKFPRTKSLREYFDMRVKQGDGCWEWQGRYTNAGYGMAMTRRRISDAMGMTAPRLAWLLLVGPIPSGLQIDHLCLNPGCVRPDHLEVVTPLENVRRINQWPELRSDRCPRGHLRDAENTYRWRNQITCRPCNAVSQAKRKRIGTAKL